MGNNCEYRKALKRHYVCGHYVPIELDGGKCDIDGRLVNPNVCDEKVSRGCDKIRNLLMGARA